MRRTSRFGLRRLVVVLVSALALTGALTGCGGASTDDLCSEYDKVVTKADELKNLDVSSESLKDLKAELKDLQAALDKFQEVADGRLDTAISDLRTAIRDFVTTAVEAGQEALDTALPALKQGLANVKELWAVVEKRADAECNGG